MSEYWTLFVDAVVGYHQYLGRELLNPGWGNYVTLLVVVSVAVFAAQQIAPWRSNQPWNRKDFALDAFYMVFNFFLFSAIGYVGVSAVVSTGFNAAIFELFGWENMVAFHIEQWPLVAQLAVMFVVRDFIHWNVHRLLHATPWLWEFHKVHHSVEQMGFAAHLRFHWMETVVYRTLEYIPLAMLGFSLTDFFIVHAVALTIGHLNHSNLHLPVGPLRYVLNTPQMHIWHHTKEQPGPRGCNFGISLSIWDWLFRTAYWPRDGRDEPLGFDQVETFPTTFLAQVTHGFGRRHGTTPSEADTTG